MDLVSGGLPLVLDEWRSGVPAPEQLSETVPDPTSALLVSGERALVGSVKWLEDRQFDHHDLGQLPVHRSRLPGADDATPLLVVSRNGATVGGVLTLGPQELVAAYR